MRLKNIFINIALCASACLGACSGGALDEPQIAEPAKEYVYSLDLTLEGAGESRAEKLAVEGAYLYFSFRPQGTGQYVPGYAVYTDGAWRLHTQEALSGNGLATIVYAGEGLKSTSFESILLDDELYMATDVEYVSTGASSVSIKATLKPQGTRMRFINPTLTDDYEVLNLMIPDCFERNSERGVTYIGITGINMGSYADMYTNLKLEEGIDEGYYKQCNYENERFFKLKNGYTVYALWCGAGSKLEGLFEPGTTATLNVTDNAYVQDVKTYTNSGITVSSFYSYETYNQIDYWSSLTGYTVTFQYRINDYVEGNCELDVKCNSVETYYQLAGEGVDVDNQWHTVSLSFFNPAVGTYYLRFYHKNVKFEVGTVSWSSF